MEDPFPLKTPVANAEFSIEINKDKACVVTPSSNKETKIPIEKSTIRKYVTKGYISGLKSYLKPIGEYIKEHYKVSSNQIKKGNDPPYVFVIDEINRGEISKIFGELFFSIDPDYRGEKGKVKTQYSNLIEDEDPFKDGFYIPENVYIIGTMNDIDRSVESFDFAMRRRFVWQEVTATESAVTMELTKKFGEETVLKMESLNNVIKSIDGLDRHYQIGAAYFLKLEKLDKDYNRLWQLHLKPLLWEYVRALPYPNKELEKLEKAYYDPKKTDE